MATWIPEDGKLKSAVWQMFYDYAPQRFDASVSHNADMFIQSISFIYDEIDYYYRRFLIGEDRDLRTVYRQINDFRRLFPARGMNPNGTTSTHYFTRIGIINILQEIEKQLLSNELYELMDRHNRAVKRIKDRLHIIESIQLKNILFRFRQQHYIM